MPQVVPRVWADDELEAERRTSTRAFRRERIGEPLERYLAYFQAATAVGTTFCVPKLSGVFALANLKYTQNNHLYLIWAHDLGQLGTFLEATRH